jgi:hypothetical protein
MEVRRSVKQIAVKKLPELLDTELQLCLEGMQG